MLSESGLSAHLEDGVLAEIEMQDGARVTATWCDIEDHKLFVFWNPTVKATIVRLPGDPRAYRYDKLDAEAQAKIDDAIRFQGLGRDAPTVASRHSQKRPLEVNFQALVGVDARGQTVAISISSTTDAGFAAMQAAWDRVRENYRRNQPERERRRQLEAIRQAAEDAERAAEDAERAAEDAERRAKKAERALRQLEWEAMSTRDRLRGLGIIP
jgi:hypothetical protein